MNKHAAEKIATEYYDLGVQLALQETRLTKYADAQGSLAKKLLGGAVNTANRAGLGIAGTGLGVAGTQVLNTSELMGPNLNLLLAILSGGAGGLAGLRAGTKKIINTPEFVWDSSALGLGGKRLRLTQR